jgi:hypothetical protein
MSIIEKEVKPKKKYRTVIKIGGIVIIAIILLISILFLIVNYSNTVEARILVEDGTVKVNGELAVDKSLLKEGDIIETFSGLATVILYESIVINLEEDTKITLEELKEDHPLVNQEQGTTWNKFTKLFGVDDYSIKSGNTFASVRGTSFEFSDGKVFTGEGEVKVKIEDKEFSLVAGRVAEKVKEEIRERAANEEELRKLKLRRERVLKSLIKLRELEIEKHPKMVKLVQSQTDLSKEDIMFKLKEADAGRYDIEETLKQAPIKTRPIEKVAEITKKIRELTSNNNREEINR